MEEAILLLMLSMAGLVVLGIIVLAGRMLLHIAKMIDKLGGWE